MKRSSVDKMKERNKVTRSALRRLVRRGKSRMDAARIVGVGYDCALRWTMDIDVPSEKPTGKSATEQTEEEIVPATEATTSSIGTFERVEVYRERVARGEHLYHPWDSKLVARSNND